MKVIEVNKASVIFGLEDGEFSLVYFKNLKTFRMYWKGREPTPAELKKGRSTYYAIMKKNDIQNQ